MDYLTNIKKSSKKYVSTENGLQEIEQELSKFSKDVCDYCKEIYNKEIILSTRNKFNPVLSLIEKNNKHNYKDVLYFKININGYPITAGLNNTEYTIRNLKDLQNFFNDLINTPGFFVKMKKIVNKSKN